MAEPNAILVSGLSPDSPSKQHPVSELYHPAMITIDVYDKPGDPEAQQKARFVVPRGLLTAHSVYFQKAVARWPWQEAEKGQVCFDEVQPWVFQVFVGWLYFQRIYHDPDWVEPTKFDKHEGVPRRSNASLETSLTWIATVDPPCADEQATVGGSTLIENAHDRESVRVADDKGRAHKRRRLDTTNATSVTNMMPVLEGNPLAQSITRPRSPQPAPPPSSDAAPDEEDDSQPITWRWRSLFELFVFADRYDARGMRMAVMDIIQEKLLRRDPHEYDLPANESVGWVVSHLLSTSTLRRLLVDVWGTWLSYQSPNDDKQAQAEELELLPQSFLLECLVASKRFAFAAYCHECSGGRSEDCTSTDHDASDALHFVDRDLCTYHEHGDDEEEKVRCVIRWECKRWKLR